MRQGLPIAYRNKTQNTRPCHSTKAARTYYLNSIIEIAEILRDCPQNDLLYDLSELVDEYGRTWGVSPGFVRKGKRKRTKEKGSYSECMILDNHQVKKEIDVNDKKDK